MKYEIESNKIIKFFEITEELEKLLTEVIVDLYEIKGTVPIRHNYIYYRNQLWEVKNIIRDNIKELHEKRKIKKEKEENLV